MVKKRGKDLVDLIIAINHYALRNGVEISLDDAIDIIETVGEETSIEELETYLKGIF